MKHVNTFRVGERPVKVPKLPAKVSGKKATKKPVVLLRRQMKRTALAQLQEIPGVDYLEDREQPSKFIAGPFYTDEIDNLVEIAKSARKRAKQGMIFIARVSEDAFSIFKRRAAK